MLREWVISVAGEIQGRKWILETWGSRADSQPQIKWVLWEAEGSRKAKIGLLGCHEDKGPVAYLQLTPGIQQCLCRADDHKCLFSSSSCKLPSSGLHSWFSLICYLFLALQMVTKHLFYLKSLQYIPKSHFKADASLYLLSFKIYTLLVPWKIFEAWVCVSLQGASGEGQIVGVLVKWCLMWFTEQFQSGVMAVISEILSSSVVKAECCFHFIGLKSGCFSHSAPNWFLVS